MSVITNPSINSVGQALGDLQTSVGSLCVSTHIKKWSARKPVRSSQRARLADMSIADISYGFNQGEAVDNIYARTPDAILNLAIANGGDWVYQRPRGVNNNYNEPFRLYDFEGYDHSAGPQFTPYIFPTRTSAVNPQAVMDVDTDASIKLWNFKIVSNSGVSQNSWRYGIVFRKEGEVAGAKLALSNYIVGGSLNPQGRIDCNLGLTLYDYGIYDCAFVATQETDPNNLQNLGFIYLHNGLWQTRYSVYATGIDFSPYKPNASARPFVVYSDEGLTMDYRCFNNESTQISNIVVHLKFWMNDGGNWNALNSEATSAFSLVGNDEIQTIMPPSPSRMYPSYTGLSEANLGIQIWVTWGSAGIRYYEFSSDGSGSMVAYESTVRSLAWLRNLDWVRTN